MSRAVLSSLLAAATVSTFAACGSAGPGGANQGAPPVGGGARPDGGSGSEGATSASPDGSPGSAVDGASSSEAAEPMGDAGAAGCPMLVVDAGPNSAWVHVDTPGHLAYKTLATGERILDFSSAG